MRDRLIEALLRQHAITLELEPSHGGGRFPGNSALDRYRVYEIGIGVGWVYIDYSRWFAYQDAGDAGFFDEVDYGLRGPFRTRYAAVRSIGSLGDWLPPDEEIPS